MKFKLPWGKFWPLRTLWRNLNMFIDILDFGKQKKVKKIRKKGFEKVISDLCKNGPDVHKNTFNKKLQKKN